MALSYGCKGCDGNGYYAEIVQILANASNDMFDSIVVEDSGELKAKEGENLTLVVYACPKEGAPIRLKKGQFTVATGTGYSWTTGNDYITIGENVESPISVGVNAYGQSVTVSVTVTPQPSTT